LGSKNGSTKPDFAEVPSYTRFVGLQRHRFCLSRRCSELRGGQQSKRLRCSQVRATVQLFLSAALGTAAIFIAVYAVWLIVDPAEEIHFEVAIPALLLALVSAATAVVLWRRA
jgi:hypothetical protein